MEEFFKSIKIRKLILVYICVVIFLSIVSELTVIKSSNLLDENLFILLCNLVILLWFILKLKKSKIHAKKDIINLKNTLNIKDVVFSILINIAFTIATIGIIVSIFYGLRYVYPSGIDKLMNELNKTEANSLYATIINIISASFIAPIVEEFVFRGVFLNRLKIKVGIKKAIIISSILFGFMHPELGIISAIVFGICMSLIYLKTNNIFITSAIHFINNFIVSGIQVISLLISKGAPEESITMNDFNIFWLIFGIFSLIAGVLMFSKFIKENWRKETTNI